MIGYLLIGTLLTGRLAWVLRKRMSDGAETVRVPVTLPSERYSVPMLQRDVRHVERGNGHA